LVLRDVGHALAQRAVRQRHGKVVGKRGDDRIVGGHERFIFRIMKRRSRHVKVRAAPPREAISRMIIAFRNAEWAK
ncbi:hypothetical protein MWK11_26885, partial [Escherichia coli]|uniref:hypothetical protein n=1 Tax=Escherichia coli TaxID=562 RepID=UPI00201F08D1